MKKYMHTMYNVYYMGRTEVNAWDPVSLLSPWFIVDKVCKVSAGTPWLLGTWMDPSGFCRIIKFPGIKFCRNCSFETFSLFSMGDQILRTWPSGNMTWLRSAEDSGSFGTSEITLCVG